MLKSTEWLLDPSTCPGYQGHEIVSKLKRGDQIHFTEHHTICTPKRYALVNITTPVEEAIERSNVEDGFCFVSAMHITAGVYINDAETGLLQDISEWIENLAPFGKDYRHHATGEDNGDAHLKSYLTNHSLMAPITKGRLDFGPWQQIFYAEFDGRRNKRLLVKITGLSKLSKDDNW